MAKEKVCGIYRIENLINHKSYIGQSVDIYERWRDHKWALNNKRHNNSHLVRAWYKYGPDSFEFTIIETCNEDKLNEREIYWVAYYDAYYNGYNQTKGGDGCLGKVWAEEEREKVSRAILQISLNGDIVNRFINIDDAEDQTGIDHRQIWNCANKHVHKIHRNGKTYEHVSKTAGGYIWCYADCFDEFVLEDYLDTRSTPIRQFDLNWNYIKTWPSSERTKEEGYGPTIVLDACKGKWKQAYGYIWTFDDIDLEQYIDWYKDHFDVKYIGQYDLNGQLVNVWSTPKEAEIDGFRACSVREVLNGKQKVHKGYTFCYISWRELEKLNWKGQINYGKCEKCK